jgi:hypothetical protein
MWVMRYKGAVVLAVRITSPQSDVTYISDTLNQFSVFNSISLFTNYKKTPGIL